MAIKHFEDSLTLLYEGDSRSMAEVTDRSVHTCVTSPPYWGLRSYKGLPEMVWGDGECAHRWERQIKADDAGQGHYTGKTRWQDIAAKARDKGIAVKSVAPTAWAKGGFQTAFCSLCGAWRGHFGLEPTLDCGRPKGELCNTCYICHSLIFLREVRRVLRDDGCCFWNIGDSYASSGMGHSNQSKEEFEARYPKYKGSSLADPETRALLAKTLKHHPTLKPLDMCLIPQRLALAAQADGWFVRSMIVWHKPSCMPESVNGVRWERHRIKVKSPRVPLGEWQDKGAGGRKGGFNERVNPEDRGQYEDCPGCPKCSANDGLVLRRGSWRPTDAVEYILMLTKTARYYCDAEAVREAYTEPLNRWGGDTLKSDTSKTAEYKEMLTIGYSSAVRVGRPMRPNEAGRNLRNVWTFPTQGYAGPHFASFPEELPMRCIKASTSEVGVCARCGAPWARVIETSYNQHRQKGQWCERGINPEGYARSESMFQYGVATKVSETIGWRPACKCGVTETKAAIVLDPFCGTGTTLSAARNLGRKGIGYELSEEYCQLTIDRCKQLAML